MPSNLLEKIRDHPGLYLGERSLTALSGAFTGYQLALAAHGISDDTTFQLPEDFHDWVAYRLHYKESTSGWKNMILDVTENESDAFSRFFALLDEHSTRAARVVAKLIGLNKHYTIGPVGHERTERFPASISLVAYTEDPGFFTISDEPGVPLPRQEFFPSLDWFETFMNVDRSQLTVLDTETFERWNKGAGR